MNKEYIYKDGKALVIDEDNNQKTIDYYDNLDKVLIQEDLIEAMEEEIKKLEKEVSQYKKDSKFSRFIWVWYPFLLFAFGPLIMFPIMGNFFGVTDLINTSLFGEMSAGTYLGLIAAPIFAIPGALLTMSLHSKEKRLDKDQKGKETQLEYLKRGLVEERENLEQLKLDKTNSKQTEDFYISMVDSKEMLEGLKNFLNFYYNVGYNEKKYFKYFQQGKLDKYLGKITNDLGIQFANEYFEEKGAVLAKKRVLSKNKDNK